MKFFVIFPSRLKTRFLLAWPDAVRRHSEQSQQKSVRSSELGRFRHQIRSLMSQIKTVRSEEESADNGIAVPSTTLVTAQPSRTIRRILRRFDVHNASIIRVRVPTGNFHSDLISYPPRI
jgi:hypothetical protein